jgi:serine/threonine-protein kinase
MPATTRIDALLSRYERLRDAGETVSLSQLCAAEPELMGPLAERVAALEAGRNLLGDTLDTSSDPPAAGDGPRLIPGYEILRPLGEGGMGVVYLARQVALDRMVALKTLPAGGATAQAQARMRHEAATIAKLSHPNVVQVYDVGTAGGRTYFALELMPGGSLAERLRGGPFAPRAAAELVRRLCAALDATHRVGVVHCDLKPANILLAADGTPKVADFGLARRYDDANRQTRTGTVRGTPSYMAPEQARGQLGEFGPPVDVYALGGVLYELLTGRPPFLAATLLETMLQVESRDPVPPRQLNPGVPADLETVCLKCLEKSPARRYATAAELGDDLSRFLDGRPVLARRAGWGERAWRWCRRYPSRAALVAVCGLSLTGAAGGGVWVNRRLDAWLTRTELARDAAQGALVSQAADRLDGELRELAAIPHLIAAGVESGEAVRPEWLTRLVANDERVHGLCVALEPDAGAEFALLVQRWTDGVRARRLDREPGTPYRQRSWYAFGRDAGRGWTEPYHGTDDRRTLMVSHVVPIRKGGRFAGVVVLDLALHSLQSVQNTLRDLIPDTDDSCRLLTRDGRILYESDEPSARRPRVERGATVGSTGWRLVVSLPDPARGGAGR